LETYRIYFRCPKDVIIGRNDLIDVEDDCTALTIAAELLDGCSDLAASFELWHGPRLVGTSYAQQRHLGDAASISAETQARVARYEELILDSHWAIAKSKQLLDRTRRSGAS
jgi:hypothetical protein